MRTTLKRQSELLREAKSALGCKTSSEVFSALTPYREAVSSVVGRDCMITPYRNNVWGVSWIGEQAKDCFQSFSSDD